ncbi:MAG: hypothetical protein ABMA00_22190, partial [Gemmatimonas sp.]
FPDVIVNVSGGYSPTEVAEESGLVQAQLATFKESDAKLKELNADRFKLLDSLKKEARPRTSGTPAPEDEVRMLLAGEALGGVARDIRVSYDEAATAALPTLDESQQKSAQELMEKYQREMQSMLREKLGGRGGGGAPGGRGGRPPQ